MTENSTALLAEQLMQQLQGAPMQQMAQQLGQSPAQTQSAVAMALPMLLGALGNNAQNADGAQSLLGALMRDHAPGAAAQPQAAAGLGGLDLGGLLGSVLGGAMGGGAAASSPADAILSHMFGGNRGRAESNFGQASGLGGNAGSLLQMLAPLVMSFLANRVSAGGMDAGGLSQMLGQERQRSQQRAPGGDLLTNLLDQDGDGQLGLGDLLKIGGSLLGGRR